MSRKIPQPHTQPVERKLTKKTIERLNQTRERIMRGRVFTDDSTDIVRRFRDGGPDNATRAPRDER
ncbi:MAG: hypothetical protein AB7R89_11530 [Dehalococcoidia bacterium]